MASETAKALAREISAYIRKPGGRKMTLGALLLKHGYSVSTSKKPKLVTETQSFKEVVNPVIEKLEKERDEIIERMAKTRRKAGYSTLVYGLDVVQKNLQLLKGKPTSIQFGAHVDLTDKEKAKLDKLLG